MNESNKRFVSLSVWLTAFLLLLRCLISWEDVKIMWEGDMHFNLFYTLFGFIGEAIGVAAIMMAMFNKWAWKWKWLSWTHSIPVLAKIYEGSIVYDRDKVPCIGRLFINQTYLTVSVQLKTAESSSRTLTATFIEYQGVRFLIYTYLNEPRAEILDKSPIHYGTAMLDVTNPMLLEGNYYTVRNSKGSMRFKATQ